MKRVGSQEKSNFVQHPAVFFQAERIISAPSYIWGLWLPTIMEVDLRSRNTYPLLQSPKFPCTHTLHCRSVLHRHSDLGENHVLKSSIHLNLALLSAVADRAFNWDFNLWAGRPRKYRCPYSKAFWAFATFSRIERLTHILPLFPEDPHLASLIPMAQYLARNKFSFAFSGLVVVLDDNEGCEGDTRR